MGDFCLQMVVTNRTHAPRAPVALSVVVTGKHPTTTAGEGTSLNPHNGVKVIASLKIFYPNYALFCVQAES